MIDDRDWPSLDAYLSGECSAAEAAELERRMADDPELRALVAGIRRASSGAWQPDTAGAWHRVRARALESGSPALRFPAWRRLGHPTLQSTAWRVAAAAVLVAAGAAAWGLTHYTPAPAEAIAWRQIDARAGQSLTVALPDGSRVLLGPESHLRFPAGLAGKTRSVALAGDAYFTVAHDAGRPFVVEAGPAVTRVLGTRFLVSARPGERPVQVVVSEGRVLVRAATATDAAGIVLTRGDLGRVEPGGRVAVRHGVDLERELDWTRGRLVFQDAPVAEAFTRLAHWYGVRLVAADSTLSRRRFSGTVQNLPLPELLQALTLALDARYERHGDDILFHAQSSPPRGD